jgi:hypothetical protein
MTNLVTVLRQCFVKTGAQVDCSVPKTNGWPFLLRWARVWDAMQSFKYWKQSFSCTDGLAYQFDARTFA